MEIKSMQNSSNIMNKIKKGMKGIKIYKKLSIEAPM
jgi:hypothetical protein